MAEFYDLEKSGTFGFVNRILWGNGSALNPHKTGTNGIQVGTKLNSIHCEKCSKLLEFECLYVTSYQSTFKDAAWPRPGGEREAEKKEA
jgi:hypothetical protein